MPRYEVTIGVNVREYHKIEVDAADETGAKRVALREFDENRLDKFDLCLENDHMLCDEPDVSVIGVEPDPINVNEDDEEEETCAVCGDPFGMGAGPARRSCVDPSICEYCYTHGDAD